MAYSIQMENKDSSAINYTVAACKLAAGVALGKLLDKRMPLIAAIAVSALECSTIFGWNDSPQQRYRFTPILRGIQGYVIFRFIQISNASSTAYFHAAQNAQSLKLLKLEWIKIGHRYDPAFFKRFPVLPAGLIGLMSFGFSVIDARHKPPSTGKKQMNIWPYSVLSYFGFPV